jgi:Acetyltransferase (GNAT) domain
MTNHTGSVNGSSPGRLLVLHLEHPRRGDVGYAAEACAATLGWFAGALPGEPVVLTTQTANIRAMRVAAKLGFTEVERLEEYGAEQWFGVWSSVTPSGRARPRQHGGSTTRPSRSSLPSRQGSRI